MLYDASVSDAGDGNEVDDKEFTQKNSVHTAIDKSVNLCSELVSVDALILSLIHI